MRREPVARLVEGGLYSLAERRLVAGQTQDVPLGEFEVVSLAFDLQARRDAVVFRSRETGRVFIGSAAWFASRCRAAEPEPVPEPGPPPAEMPPEKVAGYKSVGNPF